ncbi:MAG: hypothetical protein COB23_04685 [Methylophaga sp.]|nr:MAG: hypothetical protein COB23_04685 [Methylophaga sp.]
MSQLASSSPEPSYITRLALQAAPFNEAINANLFFKGVQIEQRLNLLLHLVGSSGKISLLVAESGVGKSCLLTQLQQRAGDELVICRIDTHDSSDIQAILIQCLRAFGVDDDEINASSAHVQLLQHRLSQLQKLNIKPLLLLDDVNKLPPDVLEELINWLLWQQGDNYLLQAVMAENSELEVLSRLHERIQIIDLPPLNEEEVKGYLIQRMAGVGYQEALPFNDKDIKRFYRQSKGNPCQINKLAHQQLLGVRAKLNNPIKLNFTRFLRWSGFILLACSLLILLIFQDQVNGWLTTTDTQDALIEQPIMEDDELATVIVDEQSDNNDIEERKELISLVDEISEIDIVDSKLEVNTIDNGDESRPTVVENSVAAVNESATYQQDWILAQRSTNYTFQLMGSWQYDELIEFVDKYALVGDVAEFESIRNGRVWYALLYGTYESKKVALEASSQWPAPLNTLPSWLRRFDSVQKQLKNNSSKQ